MQLRIQYWIACLKFSPPCTPSSNILRHLLESIARHTTDTPWCSLFILSPSHFMIRTTHLSAIRQLFRPPFINKWSLPSNLQKDTSETRPLSPNTPMLQVQSLSFVASFRNVLYKSNQSTPWNFFLIRYKILELCTLHCKNIADLGMADLSVVHYSILTLFFKWWSEYKWVLTHILFFKILLNRR